MSTADPHNLQRFVEAQRDIFEAALGEIRVGRKQGHWMWFVFPQLAGLGRSPTAQFYAIASIDEARSYLAHPVLGARLRQATEAVLSASDDRPPEQVFGPTDAVKLRSSLTLFDAAEPGGIFRETLQRLFRAPDDRTLALLAEQA